MLAPCPLQGSSSLRTPTTDMNADICRWVDEKGRNMPRRRTSPAAGPLLVSLALGTAAFAAMPAPARAEQFVLFDAKFTFTKAVADNGVPNKAHYNVNSPNPAAHCNPARPTDGPSP